MQGTAAAQPWQTQRTAEAELAAEYGAAEEAISPPAAARLLLELVNAERAEHGLGALEPSIPAGRLARKHAAELTSGTACGHYDAQGRKPELRFNRIGETDYVAENLVFYEVSVAVRLTPALVRRMHRHWMDSRAHAANVLAPGHTHLGSGFSLSWEGGGTRIAGVAEFVRDHGAMEPLGSTADVAQRLQLRGRLNPGVKLSHISIGWEHAPQPPGELREEHLRYRQPPPSLLLLLGHVAPDQPAEAELRPGSIGWEVQGGQFAADFDVPAAAAGQALYVSVWAQVGPTKPFLAMTQVLLIDS